jgi:hypothetical protein
MRKNFWIAIFGFITALLVKNLVFLVYDTMSIYKQLIISQRSLLLIFSGLRSPTATASDPRKIEYSNVQLVIQPMEMMRRQGWTFSAELTQKIQACNSFHPGELMSGI